MTTSRGLTARAATLRPAVNAFTVDLEEWFHVCGVPALAPPEWKRLPARVTPTTTWLLDLLCHHDISATFFVVGWIAERYPELVHQIAEAGHEIGSHSYWHRRVFELDSPTFVEDVVASCRALNAAGVSTVELFRAPEWSINDRSLWALDELVRLGFRIDASMAPVKIVGSERFPRQPHHRVTSHGSIVELPPLVADRFGHVMPLGWGWGLRMSSPSRLLQTIGILNDAGQPTVLTIHPWELDLDPPRMKLPRGLHFAHYFRLNGFRDRLSTILAGARFGPISMLAPAAIQAQS